MAEREGVLMLEGTDLLRGVIVPLVTPMGTPGAPSADQGARLLSAMRSAGVDGLMLLGSNGEGPLLPTSAIGSFVSDVTTAWRQLGGGPVLVNVTAAGTAEMLARADAVLTAEPDALVVSPPTYFRHRDDEIVSHYAACAEVGIPIVAYNIPRYSNPLTAEVLDALLAMPHVVGIKDSSGDLSWLQHVVQAAGDRRPDFGVSQGAEGQLAAALRSGAHGIVPGIANIAPAVAIQLYTAERDGAAAVTDGAQSVVDELVRIHGIRPGVPSVKEILSWRGLCPPHVAPPLLPCTPEEKRQLKQLLAALDTHLISAPPDH